MKHVRHFRAVCVFLTLCLPALLSAQQFSPLHTRNVQWKCHGWVWIAGESMYCGDIWTHQLSKTSLDGRVLFSTLQQPPTGPFKAVLALAQDAIGNLYVVDGLHIQVFSREGAYLKTITPGIDLSQGIAVLDSSHIFVTGRAPSGKENSTATVFLIGPDGIEKSFSDLFFKGLTGADDTILNSASFLALDSARKRLYQAPQDLYEIREFDLNGSLVRKIEPPDQYRLRSPQLQHLGKAAGLAPGDLIRDIVTLPDGSLAIDGDLLASASTARNTTSADYARFVDLYDLNRSFVRRISGPGLKSDNAYFAGFDHITGTAFFRNSESVMESRLKF